MRLDNMVLVQVALLGGDQKALVNVEQIASIEGRRTITGDEWSVISLKNGRALDVRESMDDLTDRINSVRLSAAS